jgi:hypothetical protein
LFPPERTIRLGLAPPRQLTDSLQTDLIVSRWNADPVVEHGWIALDTDDL